MRRAVFALFLVFGAGLVADEPAPLPSVQLPAGLERVLRDYEKAWLAGDEAALAALFTEDGFVLSNGRPPVRGRAAIRTAYAQSGGSALALRALAFGVEKSTAFIVGGFSRSKDAPDTGKFVLVLRRQQGRWLIVADMDNSNRRSQARSVPP